MESDQVRHSCVTIEACISQKRLVGLVVRYQWEGMRYPMIIDVMPEDRTWWRSAAAPDRMGDGVLENSVKRERPLTKGLAESVRYWQGEGRKSSACFLAP